MFLHLIPFFIFACGYAGPAIPYLRNKGNKHILMKTNMKTDNRGGRIDGDKHTLASNNNCGGIKLLNILDSKNDLWIMHSTIPFHLWTCHKDFDS